MTFPGCERASLPSALPALRRPGLSPAQGRSSAVTVRAMGADKGARATEEPAVAALLQLARDGDGDAFSELARLYHAELRAHCYRMLPARRRGRPSAGAGTRLAQPAQFRRTRH